ncbi:MAG TPA: histidine kinase dimerization/phospho-acceptor domain-containing protein [Planctomycetaceae bacterium]|nr:histidine kinase dimerization/phospho-acceptor domain-containing protein [Planctomycetaceae bacterium]
MSTTTNHSRSAATGTGLEKLLVLLGPHYVLVMMLASRVLCTLGGALVIYYVTIAMRLPEGLQRHFVQTAAGFIVVSVTATVCLCLFETRTLRRVIRQTLDGQDVPYEIARRAMLEAVTFSGHHHRREAILVPATTVLPICGVLYFGDAAPLTLVLQICIAGFVGISAVLLTTYFAAERWMAVVTRHLLRAGIPANFDALPATRLDFRMNVTFGLAIAITALMIGGLANQRALDIVRNPENQQEEVTALREHTAYILVAAVTVGLILSRMLASSVTQRANALVLAMKRVQAGSLTERLEPTGNDEIDILTRQFNAMVEQLYRNDHVIRDLNVNLEQKVRKRTRQLSKNKQSLQRSLKKLREADQLKTQFFSNVSHELRTPLTMILAPVQRILEKQGSQLPTETTSLLRVTQVNAQRLLELINQLLEFSKLEAGHSTLRLANVDVPALLNALVQAASPLAEQRGVDLQLEIAPDVAGVGADEEKVDTILTNLLSNALKFTPAGGVVKLSAELRADAI